MNADLFQTAFHRFVDASRGRNVDDRWSGARLFDVEDVRWRQTQIVQMFAGRDGARRIAAASRLIRRIFLRSRSFFDVDRR